MCEKKIKKCKIKNKSSGHQKKTKNMSELMLFGLLPYLSLVGGGKHLSRHVRAPNQCLGQIGTSCCHDRLVDSWIKPCQQQGTKVVAYNGIVALTGDKIEVKKQKWPNLKRIQLCPNGKTCRRLQCINFKYSYFLGETQL